MAKTHSTTLSYDYVGPISEHLTDFLAEKRAVGIKYTAEAVYLRQIDRLTISLDTPKDMIPRKLIEEWGIKKESEAYKTWQYRQTVMRQLTKYFINHGLDTYLTTIEIPDKDHGFVPYIFNENEIASIFNAVDSLKSHIWSPQRKEVMALLFRILYSCGLRLGEALSLKISDVDLDNGVFTVVNGKNHKDRYVPISPELQKRCNDFVTQFHKDSSLEQVFLPAPDGGFYSKGSTQYAWQQILRLAAISKTDDGPRIHDLRHTFAVCCLKNWIKQDKDLNAMLPVLSAYLGHKRLSATSRYLRLTADVFPEVVAMVEAQFGGMVPVGGYLNETE